MSLLGDIVGSIGSGKPFMPPAQSAKPSSPAGQRPSTDVSKAPRPATLANSTAPNGLKRKAEDGSPKQPEKIARPNATTTMNGSTARRPAAPPLNGPRSSNEKALPLPRPRLDATTTGVGPKFGSAPTTPTTSTVRQPAKGSYADLIARAKMAQTEKGPSQVGMIKHQSGQREKVSKVAERKRLEEEKARATKEKSTGRPPVNSKPMIKSRSASPAKKIDQAKVLKAPRPPLHGPPKPVYKGTMGKQSERSTKPPQRRRYDDYLGTDEEEDSEDMGEDDAEEGDGYGTDASSDMEAGAFDLEEEDQRAAKYAREEDAKELALENQLKREKEERRKKLMNLANKKR